jgi:salicylate hydroxylase
MWMGTGKHFLTYPLRRGELVNIAAFATTTVDAKESWSAKGSVDDFAAEYAGFDPIVEELISRAAVISHEVALWGLFDRDPLDQWVNGRVGLLGDAAHAMLPHHGQGANQTIEDGFTLARALEGKTSAQLPEALKVYEHVRLTRAATVQRMSRRNGELFDMNINTGDLDTRDKTLRKMALEFTTWVREYDADTLVPARPAPVY